VSQSVVVTGGSGFVGHRVVEILLAAGREVTVFDLARPAQEGTRWWQGDVRDSDSLAGALAEARPSVVIHLAARVFEPECRRDPQGTFDLNLRGTVALLEACRAATAPPRVLLALSSAIYGQAEGENIDEDAPLRPWTVYGASKAACDAFGDVYCRTYGLEVIRVVPFNITGPGGSPLFVVSDWARQAALIEAGRQEPVIETGDVSAVRDFTDVRDVARAYVALVERGRAGERYNVASGQPVTVGSILDILASLVRRPFEPRVAPGRVRRVEIPVQAGSYAKLKRDTGWEPSIELEQSVADLLDHWRRVVAEDADAS
jgi:GDP-4-dehydro-6-deoxy-D-mannose reductase